jgi:predicted transcriptional regulator
LPAGNISIQDRHERLKEVKNLKEEGKTDQQIADGTGLSLTTVKRYKRYLRELDTTDLTAEDIQEKRVELYEEAIEAGEEAHALFIKCKEDKKWVAAKSWFLGWMDSLRFRAQLYGLDNVKIDSFTQINQQINTYEPEKVDMEAGQKLADMLKKKHEEKLKEADG